MKDQVELKNGLTIGANLPTQLNVLLGFNKKEEMFSEYEKLKVLSKNESQVGVISDLSLYRTSSKNTIWNRVLNDTDCIAATVPIYLAQENRLINLNMLKESIQEQSEAGVGIITIHPTATRSMIYACKSRLIPITSRGGAVVVNDLKKRNEENNAYVKILDFIIDVAKRNGTVLSIGSTFRSATILDAFDATYISELQKQMEIADLIRSQGVSVIIETPGHADPRKLQLICDLLHNQPYPIMPLGPMPTDIGGNNDDTVAVIGAVLMGTNGCADILSVVTNAEHTGGIPSLETLLLALEKYRIAKHIIDLYKTEDKSKDFEVSKERSLSISCKVDKPQECDRCGYLCPLYYTFR
ncbi:MAG: phosphomethylpyrimidine synthase ThiC [bacterium]|nr:phosphomethylpyrimidine synthase ThiC [bacterium]